MCGGGDYPVLYLDPKTLGEDEDCQGKRRMNAGPEGSQFEYRSAENHGRKPKSA